MCAAEAANLADKLCAPREGQTVLQQQHLFNVYIHSLPSSESVPFFLWKQQLACEGCKAELERALASTAVPSPNSVKAQ